MTKKRSKKVYEQNRRYKQKTEKYGGAYTLVDKDAIFERDGYRCYLCNAPVVIFIEQDHPNRATIDHVVPLSKGGDHTAENVKTCCFKCNNSKGSFYSPDLNEIIDFMTTDDKIQSYLNTAKYIIPIRAKPKPRMTKADTWKKRPIITEYWAYKDLLKILVAKTSWQPTDTIRLVFMFEPAASFPNKKKEALYYTPHQQKPDTDNLVKAFKDCLYEKDETVWCDEAIKIYGPTNQILICSQ